MNPKAGVTEFYLPMDIGGDATKMLKTYIDCCKAEKKMNSQNIPKFNITALTKLNLSEHELLNSDIKIEAKLAKESRHPETQLKRFLGAEVPFLKFSPCNTSEETHPWDFDLKGIIEKEQKSVSKDLMASMKLSKKRTLNGDLGHGMNTRAKVRRGGGNKNIEVV